MDPFIDKSTLIAPFEVKKFETVWTVSEVGKNLCSISSLVKYFLQFGFLGEETSSNVFLLR